MSTGELTLTAVIVILTLVSGAIAKWARRPCLSQLVLVLAVLALCWIPEGTPYGKLALTIWTIGPMTFAYFIGLLFRSGPQQPRQM